MAKHTVRIVEIENDYNKRLEALLDQSFPNDDISVYLGSGGYVFEINGEVRGSRTLTTSDLLEKQIRGIVEEFIKGKS
ncbi:MAG: hypothetical protein ABSF98_25220 [Bryobacteraceae bacterium]|jgi:hypothetical protein